MVRKTSKKTREKSNNAKKNSKDEGVSLDDAFADDEGVDYAESKPRKIKNKGVSEDEIENELNIIEHAISASSKDNDLSDKKISITASKDISKLKKGDKVTIDGRIYEVDSQYILIEHGSTKEMAIEIFELKTDKDYQLRYFDDQVEATLDLYELQEIMYFKKPFSKISW